MKKYIVFILITAMLCSVNISVWAGSDMTSLPGVTLLTESFENGINENIWSYYNQKSYVSVSTDDSHSGAKSVYINDKDSKTGGLSSAYYPADGGKIYTLSVFMNTDEKNIRAYVKFFNSSKKQLSSTSYHPVESGKWSELRVSLCAPISTAYVQFVIAGSASGVGSAYVDDINLYESYFSVPTQAEAVNSKIVEPVGKKLLYNTYDEKGNKLSDYSYAGFKSGKYTIPESKMLKVAAELSPSGEESDTEYIQNAINDAVKLVNGEEMVVVKLKAGQYNITSPGIKMKTGVILSGEGQGPTGTVLYAKDAKTYTVVAVSGSSPSVVGSGVSVVNPYIKSGSSTFELSNEDIVNFKVGDTIRIHHKATAEWDKHLGLENATYYDSSDGKTYDTSWQGKFVVNTERTIKEINGNTITVDFPFFIHYDNAITPLTVYKLNDSKRIRNSGVENLRIYSYFDKSVVKNGNYTDDNHASYGVQFKGAKDCFAQNVTVKHIQFSAFYCHEYSKQITIRNCSSLEPVSTIAGGERYIFGCTYNTQQILITGCYSHHGRHDFETSYTATGPYAFVDNVVDEGITASETHGTWSTGVLYDGLLHIDADTSGFIASTNRGVYGSRTSQGWSGAGIVFWNSLASSIISNDVAGDYQNFLVGIYGVYTSKTAVSKKSSNLDTYKKLYRTDTVPTGTYTNFATNDGTSLIGDCYKEAEFTPVNPRSLYKAQLSERITGDYRNFKPNSPVIVYPKYDQTFDSGKISISGFAQSDASAVNIYIDDVLYDSRIISDGMYVKDVELSAGVHKIYAKQVINGVESCKTPDRFITVDNPGNDNPLYLQSMYGGEEMTQLTEETRKPYGIFANISAVDIEIKGNSAEAKVSFNDKTPQGRQFELTVILYNEKSGKPVGFKNILLPENITEITVDIPVDDIPTKVKSILWEDFSKLRPLSVYENKM